MEKNKEPKKKDNTKIQKIIDELLKNGYETNDLKSYFKEKFYPRVEKSQKELWDKENEERKKKWFKKAWMYGWPVIPTYDKLIKYILREAGCYELEKRFEKVLKPNPQNHDQPIPYNIELTMSNAIGIALAFGYVIGELAEVTDREPFEYLKQVIFENKLLPYLPREKKTA